MKYRTPPVVLALLASFLCVSALARPKLAEPPRFEPLRTLHVSPFGDDTADGLSPERALRSISAAAKIVAPGDLVLVKGGIYDENVHLTVPGTAENPIVFRAAAGETALVNGGYRPRDWSRVPGTRHAYEAKCPLSVNFVMDERDTVRYMVAPSMDILDEQPGSFIYDSKTRSIMVHPHRSLAPEQTGLVVVGFGAYSGLGDSSGRKGYAYEKGFWPRAPHNRVEGFLITYQPIGIQLRSNNTEAWNNTVYGCLTGVELYSHTNNVLANNTTFNNDGLGVLLGNSTGGRILGNLSYGNTPRGAFLFSVLGGHAYQMALYGGSVQDPTFEGNLAVEGWDSLGRGPRVLRFKSAHGKVRTRGNTLVNGWGYVGWGSGAEHLDNTVLGGKLRIYGGGNVTPAEAAKHNSVVERNLFLEKYDSAEYADPARFDYRPHAGNSNLGKGAWPVPAPVRYVSPDGDDSAAGNSPAAAWKTIAYACASAKAGDTIYVMPGVYRESVEIKGKGGAANPIELLSYGRGRVEIAGDGVKTAGIVVKEASHVIVDGFIFTGFAQCGIKLEGGDNIKLANNVFDGMTSGIDAEGSSAAIVENNSFVDCETGVNGRGLGTRLVLRNNLVARGKAGLAKLDAATESVTISERNAFAGPLAEAWLTDWSAQFREAHPSVVADADLRGPDYLLPAFSSLSFAGLGKKPLGARGERPEEDTMLPLEDFEVVFLSPERVLVGWITPGHYANALVSWSEEGGKVRRARVNQYVFSTELRLSRLTQSLDNLKPDTEYRVSLEVSTPAGRSNSAELTVRTPAAAREATTLYVDAEKGSDSNDGRARGSALSTINGAILKTAPGDTILVAPGVYREMVTLMCGGLDKERRLTIRSEKPGKAIVDLGEFWPSAFDIRRIKHITLDGFRVRGPLYSSLRKSILLEDVVDIVISNCVFEGKAGGAPGTVSNHIGGREIDGLRIHNNIFHSGFSGLLLSDTENLVVDHNTFYKGGVNAMWLNFREDASIKITNNIFYDVIAPFKVNGAIMIRRPTRNLVLANNLYFRDKAKDMGLLYFHREAGDDPQGKQRPLIERAVTAEEVLERFGVGQGDLVADPMFVDAPKGDFRLRRGSPAIGMANDGKDAGCNDLDDILFSDGQLIR